MASGFGVLTHHCPHSPPGREGRSPPPTLQGYADTCARVRHGHLRPGAVRRPSTSAGLGVTRRSADGGHGIAWSANAVYSVFPPCCNRVGTTRRKEQRSGGDAAGPVDQASMASIRDLTSGMSALLKTRSVMSPRSSTAVDEAEHLCWRRPPRRRGCPRRERKAAPRRGRSRSWRPGGRCTRDHVGGLGLDLEAVTGSLTSCARVERGLEDVVLGDRPEHLPRSWLFCRPPRRPGKEPGHTEAGRPWCHSLR